MGYANRATPKNEYRLLSVPWNVVSSEGAYLNGTFGAQSAGVLDWTQTRWSGIGKNVVDISPKIQIQIVSDDSTKDGTYQDFYYVTNAKIAEGPDKQHPMTAEGWCDGNGMYASPEIAKSIPGLVTSGVAVWYRDAEHDEPVATESGEVPTKAVTITCVNGGEYRLRAPGFPKATYIKDLVFDGLDGSGELDWTQSRWSGIGKNVVDVAPKIQIQIISDDQTKDGTYQDFYYVANAKVAEGPDKTHPVTQPGWCDGNGLLASPDVAKSIPGLIPVTGAFWIRGNVGATGNFTITFNP